MRGQATAPAVASGVITTGSRQSNIVRLLNTGPYGNPLLFVHADVQGSITLSTDHYDLLTAAQQAFFFADAETPNSWSASGEQTAFQVFHAAISLEAFYNERNVMGDDSKGVAIYSNNETDSNLIRYSGWWPVILDLGAATLEDDTTIWTQEDGTTEVTVEI